MEKATKQAGEKSALKAYKEFYESHSGLSGIPSPKALENMASIPTRPMINNALKKMKKQADESEGDKKRAFELAASVLAQGLVQKYGAHEEIKAQGITHEEEPGTTKLFEKGETLVKDCEKEQDLTDAVDCFNKVLEAEPDNARAWYLKGIALRGLMDWNKGTVSEEKYGAESLESLTKALELEPENEKYARALLDLENKMSELVSEDDELDDISFEETPEGESEKAIEKYGQQCPSCYLERIREVKRFNENLGATPSSSLEELYNLYVPELEALVNRTNEVPVDKEFDKEYEKTIIEVRKRLIPAEAHMIKTIKKLNENGSISGMEFALTSTFTNMRSTMTGIEDKIAELPFKDRMAAREYVDYNPEASWEEVQEKTGVKPKKANKKKAMTPAEKEIYLALKKLEKEKDEWQMSLIMLDIENVVGKVDDADFQKKIVDSLEPYLTADCFIMNVRMAPAQVLSKINYKDNKLKESVKEKLYSVIYYDNYTNTSAIFGFAELGGDDATAERLLDLEDTLVTRFPDIRGLTHAEIIRSTILCLRKIDYNDADVQSRAVDYLCKQLRMGGSHPSATGNAAISLSRMKYLNRTLEARAANALIQAMNDYIVPTQSIVEALGEFEYSNDKLREKALAELKALPEKIKHDENESWRESVSKYAREAAQKLEKPKKKGKKGVFKKLFKKKDSE